MTKIDFLSCKTLHFFGAEKSKFANRLKRALPKFRADWSDARGDHGDSKFVDVKLPRRDSRSVTFKFAWLTPELLEHFKVWYWSYG